MRTELPVTLLETPDGRRADAILRSCVHCGFCNATCPTYLLQGDELDGPRGRIYLIKDLLETGTADTVTQTHLDRCLTCRSCESTCPSGVAYGELLEIGRATMARVVPRPPLERAIRRGLRAVVPRPGRFRALLVLGRAFRWLLPARLRGQVPVWRALRLPRAGKDADPSAQAGNARTAGHGRILLLEGCVQRVATPDVNAALRRLLTGRGIEVLSAREEACCGSLDLHLGHDEEARAVMIRNLEALAPLLDRVDAVVSTASGCGVTVKDYGRLLAHVPAYAGRARQVSALARDVAEYLADLGVEWSREFACERVAWHAPCTLQHGQRVTGRVEALLQAAGYTLVPVRDPHLCCGSAGTYSILEPALSKRLREARLAALGAHSPEVIATANVGCQLHLAAAAGVPVVHWLQLLR
ncbi:MAG: glycolate oxidase subunit GlcF [Pseudomonadales bacterium]|nr:glycolate oxidase subunit GlcF [Pseudomonadales bacterium]